ncbi:MAG: hypothetical protein AB9882_14740 [Ignavibacteriaceae bacterium]
MSGVFHFAVLGFSLFFYDYDVSRSLPYNINLSVAGEETAKEVLPDEVKKVEEKTIEEDITESGDEPSKDNSPATLLQQIKGADTMGLKQLYSEGTLNVRIKYPIGWTYIDQNVKSRLDGVTFLGIQSGGKEPPYVHLEVREKYLFNESRFKQREEIKNAELFFNEPEEMEGDVTQIVYIRTKEEYDYSIKLTVKGYENFLGYRPVFFGMIKSFQFGSRWFWEKL